jgi:hypothetical protein
MSDTIILTTLLCAARLFRVRCLCVPGARRERLASLIFTNQLLEPVMSDQFGYRARPAFRMGGLLVGVNAQRFRSFECGNASTVPTIAFRRLLVPSKVDCVGNVVHGTPEGCSRWRYTGVYGVRFVLRAGVSER